MRKLSLMSFVLAGLLSAQALAAAKVEVTWEDPKSYTDIKPVNQTRSGFQKSTFAALESHFTKLAESLPDDHVLSITVTNLDLAGQVWPASFVGFGTGGTDVRLVKRIDIPRMAFSYTLKDGAGNLVQSAEVNLKDMSFMDGVVRGFDSDNYRYEKNMLTDWYRSEFDTLTASRTADNH